MTDTTAPPAAGYDDLPRLREMLTGDEKHDDSATSTLDVLWVLYDRVLRVGPDLVDDPERDRFLLSKGHGPMAYYAVLAAKGFVDESELGWFGSYRSRLGHHPDRLLVPGVEISSGSLGHGLPVGVGRALALRARGSRARVVVLVGDGELDEGSNDEAIAFAGATGLGALTVVVVDNDSVTHPPASPLAERFAAAGWATATVDGRDHEALVAALGAVDRDRPAVVVAEVLGRARRQVV